MIPAKFRLQIGDKVALFFPGFPCDPAVTESAVSYVRSLGLNPIVESTKQDLFLAAPDLVRARLFKKYLEDASVRAIWCMRGGYGSIRLFSEMSRWSKFRAKIDKWIIGISDVTSLQLFAGEKWGTPTLHGPLVSAIGQDKVDQRSRVLLEKVLFGQIDVVRSRKLRPLNARAAKSTAVGGILSGGNLCVYASHVGGTLELGARGKILVFEDLGERAYRIDRYLQTLEQAGKFNHVKAILFGDLLGPEPQLTRATIKRFALGCPFPVWSGLDFGHGEKQLPMIFHHAARVRNHTLEQECG